MGGTISSRLLAGAKRLLRDQRGNALMLTAAALLPVLGIVGSAVDIGRAYMTQLRLQQACDAGVLAGRRAMAAGTYSDTAKGEANKMFNFNMPAGIYGSRDIVFSSLAPGSADVTGTASAILPTAIMYIFGFNQFNLAVNCTAKLEISNVDVMLVLDVTGSMRGSRIEALRTASKDFFATLTDADIGSDGQLRFGVVPYSSTVNVGQILQAADASWLSGTVRVPSRSGVEWRKVEECGWQGSGRNRQWVCEMKDRYFYTYKDRDLSVGSVAPGGELTFDTGTNGGNETATWDGCIMERFTTAFGPTATAPATALDMNIDMVPTSDDKTKWKLFLPAFTYNREQVNEETSSTDRSSMAEVGGDTAACPVPAMKLTVMTKADKTTFEDYIDDLEAKGFTYHDVGMAWGARLISPTGPFASENASAEKNDRPISRHIVFMTDGDMNTPRANLSHQGQERSLPRIGATGDSDAVARHNNRFVQLCRQTRDKGITIWVVSFGVTSNAQLNSCATSGEAYESDDAEELNANFQSIARQISKLRLSQ